MTESQVAAFVRMVGELSSMVQTSATAVQSSITGNNTGAATADAQMTRHIALLSLDVLAQNFCAISPTPFLLALPVVVDAIADTNANVSASAVLCASTVVSEAKMNSVSQLPVVIPALLEALEKLVMDPITTDANKEADIPNRTLVLVLSGLTALQRVVAALPNMLSPFLARILKCTLSTSMHLMSELNEQVATRQISVMETLSTQVPIRVLLGPLAAVREWAWNEQRSCSTVTKLLDMFSTAVALMDTDSVTHQYKRCFKFVLVVVESLKECEANGVTKHIAEAWEVSFFFF
jgi:hypothetical protein